MIALSIALFVICTIASLIAYRGIDSWQSDAIEKVRKEEHALQAQLESEFKRKEALYREVKRLENEVDSIERSTDEFTTVSSSKPQNSRSGKEWLLDSGHLTQEQYDRASELTGKVCDDFISTCLMMSFIPPDIAKEAQLIDKKRAPSKQLSFSRM